MGPKPYRRMGNAGGMETMRTQERGGVKDAMKPRKMTGIAWKGKEDFPGEGACREQARSILTEQVVCGG